MYFDYLRFRGSVELHCHELRNSVEYLDKLSNHCDSRKYCILNVYGFMISTVLYFSDVYFLFRFTQHLK